MRIRFILFAAFTLVALIPIVFFGVWPSSNALDREIEEVSDRHLLLARNLSLALQRYDRDVRSLFLLAANHAISGSRVVDTSEVAANFHFRHICITRLNDPTVLYSAMAKQVPCPKRVPAARFEMFLNMVQPGEVNYSPVKASPDGEPIIYLVGSIGEFLVVGAIRTTYFVELGQAISFGKKGHAAIVDHTGRILAHPNSEWRQQMKDISKVLPVARMLAGETGISQFYSPAVKADMIAGFTTVPGTGWGVMIPQPMSELEDKAAQAKYFALGVILIGLGAAASVGWVISGIFNRPIQEVAEAAREMASGNLGVRAAELAWPKPKELSDLSTAFNGMAESVENAFHNEGKASRAKSEFLANMSHELRTPLNAILGFSEIIMVEKLGPVGTLKYRDYAKDIHASGRHLLELINSVLDIAKIESGKDMLQEQEIEISDLLKTVMVLVKNRADEVGIELEADVSNNLPRLLADETKMKQILVNLLSNAINFTERGGRVVLRIWCEADAGYFFQITDTGIGMAPEDVQKALAVFGQVENKLAGNNLGTGLGLPLTVALVEQHGGTLEIQTTLGAGTTVNVCLPSFRFIAALKSAM